MIMINKLVKRIIDLLVAIVLLILLSPILLATSFLILIFHGRPILYISRRCITHNKTVQIFKFRSMHRDAKSEKYSLEKRFMRDGYLDIPIDCEVYTMIGRLLERFQLVECPQLFNILFTRLSLVGNRPLPLANLDGLKKHEGWERRFDSPAGMTGITQIVGKLNQQPAQRVELEGMYSFIYNNGNILKCDFLILINTIKLVLFKKYISINEAKDIINRCR